MQSRFKKVGSDASQANRRVLRVEKELREIIAFKLLSGFHGDIEALVSVTRVIASKDLRTAKILVSVQGTEKEQEQAVEELNRCSYEFQQEVAHKLPMRYCPKIKFFLDQSFDKMLKVESILHELQTQRESI